jgi:hypothetical protein
MNLSVRPLSVGVSAFAARRRSCFFDVPQTLATSRHGKHYAVMDRQSQGAFCTGSCKILHGFPRRLAGIGQAGHGWLCFQGSVKKWLMIFLHQER